MNMTPRVAVVGSGYWGKNLIRALHGLGVLEMVCDRDETLLAGFVERYPGLRACVAFSEALRDPSITAVAVATPAETHYAIAREALLAGKGLFVEKPLVLEESQAKELIALAEERGLTLMVGHLLRYHPAFVKLKALAATGELGKINYIYSHRLNLGKIRREENILWSFAPHDISMILSLAGEEPENVFAVGGEYLHRKIVDVTTTHLDFPSGLKAHVFVSWLHPFKEQKLVVVGDKKMAVFDDAKPWREKLVLYPHEIRWENNIPAPARAEAETVVLDEAEPLLVECEHFLSCLTTGRAPRTDGHEALRVLKVLKSAQGSLDDARPGRTPARDPWLFIHPTAEVEPGAMVGKGAKIWNFSRVLAGSTVGEDCVLGQNVVVGPKVMIGRGCKIQNNVSVYTGVTLENGVFCGPSMVFTNVLTPRAGISRKDAFQPTLVGEGASLGANCTIVCPRSIGRYAMVGAGAVVTRDVPDHALVAGNPARRTGWVCRCGLKLAEDLRCPDCGRQYARGEAGLTPVNE